LENIKFFQPKYKFEIIRTDKQVAMVMANGPDGSTANLDAVKINRDNGNHTFIITNNGGRDARGGEDTVKGTVARRVSNNSAGITFKCETVDPNPNVLHLTIEGSPILDVTYGAGSFCINQCRYLSWLMNPGDEEQPTENVGEDKKKIGVWKKIKNFFKRILDKVF
jgi:hypothetical protein